MKICSKLTQYICFKHPKVSTFAKTKQCLCCFPLFAFWTHMNRKCRGKSKTKAANTYNPKLSISFFFLWHCHCGRHWDCPGQYPTLIFILWYLYLSVCISLQIPKLQIWKKLERDICWDCPGWSDNAEESKWLHLLSSVVQIAMSISNQSALISITVLVDNKDQDQGQGGGSSWWGSLMRTSVSSMTLLLALVYCWYPSTLMHTMAFDGENKHN